MGSYGFSNFTQYAPESIVSLGDTTFHELDRNTRILYQSPLGSGWAHDDTLAGAIISGHLARLAGAYLRFTWDQEYKHADIAIFSFGLPISNVDSMDLVETSRNECPPAKGATKMERNKCARFIRKQADHSRFGSSTHRIYPIFQIVDADGNKVQPYFDEYVKAVVGRGAQRSLVGVYRQ